MRGKTLVVAVAVIAAGTWTAARNAGAEVLTADRAVQLALRQSSQSIQAEAGVLDAKSRRWSAYSGILPRISADYARTGSFTDNQPVSGPRVVGGQVILANGLLDVESYSSGTTLSGSWPILSLSALKTFNSAGSALKASQFQRTAARHQVATDTRRQFYEVVKSIKLAEVSDGALRVSRDNQRRVQALFEVGSVSRSDLLKAKVQTAQSELDSLTKHHNVTVQRFALASLIGIREQDIESVDTLLVVEARDYEEGALLAEAAKNRPDLKAAEASLRSAKAALTSAHASRLPYVTVSGSVNVKPHFDQKSTTDTLAGTAPIVNGFSATDDREWRGTVAINLDLFDGFVASSRTASARAGLLRAQDARDALQRNLASEVHEALSRYREIVAGYEVALRALESATENLKLTQQKYNVGSSTILDLVDSQVQLQQAQSDVVSALAGIRQAEAELNRVVGRGE